MNSDTRLIAGALVKHARDDRDRLSSLIQLQMEAGKASPTIEHSHKYRLALGTSTGGGKKKGRRRATEIKVVRVDGTKVHEAK